LKRKDNNAFSLDDQNAVQIPDLVDVEDEVIKRLQRKKLSECISSLSEAEREVVSLHIYADLTFSQIGTVFGKSENWARVTYYRCKEKLKGMMSNE
jgi:RNA polymerase sigma-70 factor (ECF subfamily)